MTGEVAVQMVEVGADPGIEAGSESMGDGRLWPFDGEVGEARGDGKQCGRAGEGTGWPGGR